MFSLGVRDYLPIDSRCRQASGSRRNGCITVALHNHLRAISSNLALAHSHLMVAVLVVLQVH